MRPIKHFLTHPYDILMSISFRLKPIIPDALYLKILYKGFMGKSLNLKDPKAYSEKLQWLKLYNHDPLYTTLVDKLNVKEYVAKKIGEEHVIPLIASWDNVEDIDWDSLPNQFVMKVSHDSGGLVICKDKSLLDISAAKKKLKKSLKTNYFLEGREWPYKNVPRKILAEQFIQDEHGELRDYKWFCFDGVPKMCFIATGRQIKGKETTFDFFDTDFNHLDFRNGHPNADVLPEKPKGFDRMKELAAILSEGIPHVRVDFYDVNGHIYFGEMTFFHWGGMKPFEPEEWDYKIGSWIHLPEKRG